jgi:hypothetical protein
MEDHLIAGQINIDGYEIRQMRVQGWTVHGAARGQW